MFHTINCSTSWVKNTGRSVLAYHFAKRWPISNIHMTSLHQNPTIHDNQEIPHSHCAAVWWNWCIPVGFLAHKPENRTFSISNVCTTELKLHNSALLNVKLYWKRTGKLKLYGNDSINITQKLKSKNAKTGFKLLFKGLSAHDCHAKEICNSSWHAE